MMPDVSVVIPVHNEEAILAQAVTELATQLRQRGWQSEIVLAENGSSDRTTQIARQICSDWGPEAETAGSSASHPVCVEVRLIHVSTANYGGALRAGLLVARGKYVVCDEIDLGDMDFYDRSLALLRQGADLVVGSKRLADSRDNRPIVRRCGTFVINGLLRLMLDFRGTDTHGMKALRRARVLPMVRKCVVEHNVFASELVIRVQRAGLDVREIPLVVHEIRPPSMGLLRRVPKVLWQLGRLVVAIRLAR